MPGRNGASSHAGSGADPSAHDERRVWDACVIGSGASGALAAWTLRRAGLDVVIVEQGDYVDAQTSYDDLLAAAVPAWVRQDNGVWARVGYPWTTCNVGGGTVFYGGATFRLRPVDFDPGPRLGASEMPVRAPWLPDELTPYYDAVEQLVGVAGADGDPSLPREAPYPMSPVPTSEAGRLIHDAADRLGLRPFPTPLAVATRPYRGRPACATDRACISHRCETGARGDAYSVFLAPLLAGRRAGEDDFALFAGMRADRLRRKGGVNVVAVECTHTATGRRFTLRARQFLLACNAVQTAALLLRSADPRSPAGLGNDLDLVGRGLCFKLSEYVVGFRRGRARGAADPSCGASGPTGGGTGPFSTVSISDYYVDDDAPGGLGGLIYEAGPEQPFRLGPGEQVLRLECLVPDEPRWRNRVRLDRRTDPPDVVMDYQAHPRDLARLEYLVRHGERILQAAGCQIVVREPSGWALGSGHLHGTCRAGRDPRTSVTDPDGRLHTVPNVVVVDGALLPFPGGVNPTHTIQAVALRGALRLLSREYSIEFDPMATGAASSVMERL